MTFIFAYFIMTLITRIKVVLKLIQSNLIHFINIVVCLFWIASKRFRFFRYSQLEADKIGRSEPIVRVTIIVILIKFNIHFQIPVQDSFLCKDNSH